jgi:hypothetical protein
MMKTMRSRDPKAREAFQCLPMEEELQEARPERAVIETIKTFI